MEDVVSCIPAPTCKAALAEASRLWPNRLRASDGICPSAAHHQQNPNSDHETGEAFDLTNDPAHGVNCRTLVDLLVARRDPRVKYVIWNRTMWRSYDRQRTATRPFLKAWTPEPYTGSNPHTKHMHVSIKHEWRDSPLDWWETDAPDAPTQEDLLMPAAKDDDDARRCLVRQWVNTFWGREPSLDEQNILTYHFGEKGADLTLASIIDNPQSAALRQKRGW